MRLGTVYLEVAPAQLGEVTSFYRDTLGLAVVEDVPGHSVWFDVGGGSGVRLGFHAADDAHVDPGVVNISFDVADADAAAAELAEKGVQIVQGPMDAPWGPFRVAVLFDPVGHTVWLSGPGPA